MAEGDEKTQGEAFSTYLDVLQTEVTKSVVENVNNEMLDRSILQQRGQNVLTSDEMQFFNRVTTEGGFTDDSVLPVTTQERVFEDLVREHPLLDAVGLQDLGPVTRYITADPTKAYAWGPLFGDLAGQVNAAFSEQEIGTFKLTSFAAIPNDMVELGPVWLERYVRTLLVESYSTGLEFGFLNGGGPTANQPIGLTRNVDPGTGAVAEKTPEGVLTFAPSDRGELIAGELHGVVSALSTDAAGNSRNISNRVVMVVNPIDAIAVQMRNTIQTANGVWVTALPYNVESLSRTNRQKGQRPFLLIMLILQRSQEVIVSKGFNAALEDATLYMIKQYANGRPKDNKTALTYTLDIDFAGTPVV